MPKFAVTLYNQMSILGEHEIEAPDEEDAKKWGQKQAKALRQSAGVMVTEMKEMPPPPVMTSANSNSPKQRSRK